MFCRYPAAWFRIVFACVLAGGLAGCGGRETLVERGVREGILYRGNGTEPESLDPHIVRGGPEWTVVAALFEGLVTLDPATGGSAPGVAEAWSTSEDGLRWTFRLRADARWSDGAPVTADDFVYSARRLLSPALGSAHTEDTLHFVRGARAYQAGEIDDFTEVGVAAPDARTVVFTLERPTPFFLSALWQFFPVPRAAVEKHGRIDERGTAWTRPGELVGNGAFVLESWSPGRAIVVRRNPHYWDAARVRLEAVHFLPIENPATEEAAYRSGQLHLTNSLPLQKFDTYAAQVGGPLQVIDNLGVYFFVVNVSRPPLDRPEVRRALALAIDRERLVRQVLRGGTRAATSFTPPEIGGYEPPALLRFDPEEARQLLAAAGFAGGRGFPTVELLFDSRDHHRVVAEAVQQMWREHLGVAVNLRNEETRVLIGSKRQMQFDLARGSWNASSYQDPWYFLGPWVTGGLYNEAQWSDGVYDAALARAADTLDAAERFAALRQAEERFLAQMPAIPVYFTTQVFLLHPSVRGYIPRAFADRHLKYLWLE
jgi:oligopeptide transport system substrate-binding protein